MDCITHPLKGRKQSPEHIAARLAARRAKGPYHSEAHIAALRSPERRAKQSEAMRRRHELAAQEGTRLGIQQGTKLPAEVRQRMSETRRRMWADGRYANRKPPTRAAATVPDVGQSGDES